MDLKYSTSGTHKRNRNQKAIPIWKIEVMEAHEKHGRTGNIQGYWK
jgi:hypothetical protein